MTAILGGIDFPAISGGIGEHDAGICESISTTLSCPGNAPARVVPAEIKAKILRHCSEFAGTANTSLYLAGHSASPNWTLQGSGWPNLRLRMPFVPGFTHKGQLTGHACPAFSGASVCLVFQSLSREGGRREFAMDVTPRHRTIVNLGAVLIAALPFSRAAAVTTTSTMQVTAQVTATCTVSAADLNFGAYTGGSATNLDATTTVTATCPTGQGYTIGLNEGTGSGASVTNRLMTFSGGGSTLNYGLFSDSTRAANWTDIGGANTVAGTGDGTGQAITVYGRIPSGQNVRSGTYNDTITVTMDY